jgi:hypothetical protein
MPVLNAFYTLDPARRDGLLLKAIAESHAWHFARNRTYNLTTSARGVGPKVDRRQFPLLLRNSAITFKGYIEQLGTAFPQDQPRRFADWLISQLSIPLPCLEPDDLQSRYDALDDLLSAIEARCASLGLEIVTSSGTSGRFTILARDAQTVRSATDAYFTAIRHAWGIGPEHHLIFMMPANTRISMARIARLGTTALGWENSGSVEYTMPFDAGSDDVRIRTGRTYRDGPRGTWEKWVLHRLMVWGYDVMAKSRFAARTIDALGRLAAGDRPLMLLGGLVQLDELSQRLLQDGGVVVPDGSRIATGGGIKHSYPRSPTEIWQNLRRTFRSRTGSSVAVSDVYGMAEAHWAAFECAEGNHHLPPWVYVAVTDDDDRPLQGSDVTGYLAFWDPLGGGRVYPPFFQTSDRVRLMNGNGFFDPTLVCPCGDDSPYLARGTIRRVDLIEEAGCGATL